MTDKPAKVFPCDCGSEGLMAKCCGDYASINEVEDLKDCEGAPFITVAFWKHETKLAGGNKLSLRERIRYAWRILWGNGGWDDMVCFRSNIAKNFAHHILYLISKHKKEMKQKPLVEDK